MDYSILQQSLNDDYTSVLSNDRMRATSMVIDGIYGMKAFMPGKEETYFVVKFLGSGYLKSDGTKEINTTNIKLNNMDSADRYFIAIWNSDTEEFDEYEARYENKFLNIELPEIGNKFVTFRRINENYYVASDTKYNNTATAKKTSDDIFWEKQRIEDAKLYNRKFERIIFVIEAGSEEKFKTLLEWRNDPIELDNDNFVITYPFRTDGKFDIHEMISKFLDIGYDWDNISKFLNLEGDITIWQSKHQ